MAHRGRQQPLVGADLDEREDLAAVGDGLEFVVPRVGGVEDPEAVQSGVDLVGGPGRAVDEDHVAEDAREVGLLDAGLTGQRRVERGVGQLPVGVEGAVGDHQRHLVVAARQAEGVLDVVAHEVHPRQAPPDRRRGEVHPVVVVPQHRRALVERESVLALHVRHHRAVVGHAVADVSAVFGPFPGEHQVGRVPVGGGRGPPAVEVHHRRHRQLVAVQHGRLDPAPRLDRGPGERAFVRPQASRESRQDLRLDLALRDLVPVPLGRRLDGREHRRDRQRHRERLGQRHLAAQFGPGRGRAARPAGRQRQAADRHGAEPRADPEHPPP